MKSLSIPVSAAHASPEALRVDEASTRDGATTVDEGAARGEAVAWRWWGPSLVVIVAMLAINLLTLSRSPGVWIDEVSYGDPAINFVLGRGFTSTMWPMQTADEFFVGNAPLYTYLLVPWLKLFGTGVLAARSLNLAIVTAAVILTLDAARRANVVRRPWVAAIAALATLGGEGVGLSYRYGRYDMLGYFWFALAAWTLSLPPGRARWVGLFLACVPLGPSGYQNGHGLAAFCALGLLFTGRRYWREMFVACAGAGIGIAILFAALAATGTLGTALATIRWNSGTYGGQLPFAGRVVWGLTNEKSSLVLVAAAVASLVASIRVPAARRPAALALAALLVPPLVFAVGGRMPPYYSWFKYVPAVLALAWLLERLTPSRTIGRGGGLVVAWRWALAGALCVAAVPTLARSAFAAVEWHLRDYAQVEAFVAGQVRPNDVVFSQCTAYYALARDRKAFYPLYRMSDAERASVTLVFARPDESATVIEQIGGEWRRVGSFVAAGRSVSVRGLTGEPYKLDTFRRVNAPG